MFAKLTVKSLSAIEKIKRASQDDEGAALVEYGMLVGLIAVICIVSVTLLGTAVSTAFDSIATALTAAL